MSLFGLDPRPITAFVGMNGAGKTLSAVAYAHRSGRRVLANVRGTPFDYWEDLSELVEPGAIKHTDVIMDEAGVMFASTNKKRDDAFLALVQQLRKENARLFWTAPAYARVDKALREVTQMVVKCRGVGDVAGKGEVWPQPRWVWNFAYDAADYDVLGLTMRPTMKRLGMRGWRVAKQGPLFDTLGRVGAPALVPGPAGLTAGAGSTPDVDLDPGRLVVAGRRVRRE